MKANQYCDPKTNAIRGTIITLSIYMGVYKIVYLDNKVSGVENTTGKIFFGRFIAEHNNNSLQYAYVNADSEIEAVKEGNLIAELYKEGDI